MRRGSVEPRTWGLSTGGPHVLAALLLAGALGGGTILPALAGRGPAFPPPGDPVVHPRPMPPAAMPRTDGPAVSWQGPEPAPVGRLDLNRADALALAALPGIGPALAERIVADRAAHGPFGAPEELRRVPGIGSGRLERIRPLIRTAARP